MGWICRSMGICLHRVPQNLKTDSGKAFTSTDWKKWAEMAGIFLQIGGIEQHNFLGMGHRYRDSLRIIFDTVCSEYPILDPEIVLRCAVKGINNTMGSERLVLSYSVFGTQPSFPSFNTKLPNQKE